jgi:acetyl-CoA C-acetyltransferase
VSRSGKVAIVGAYESPRRKAPDVHPYTIQAECIHAALQEAGLTPADVDGFCTATGLPGEGGTQMNILEIADWLGLKPTFHDSTDTGGSAPISHIGHAASAIASGQADVVVVSYAGCSYSSGDFDSTPPASGLWQYEAPYGITVAASYALAAQRHMYEYGTTPEQLAQIAVTCRENAALNPDAKYRSPMTVEEVVASPMIASPLHRNDCCVITDSGGAIVLTSAERARDCKPKKPVHLLGFAEAIDQYAMSQMPDYTSTIANVTGKRAMQMAGVAHADIDCLQLYDSFTITVLLALEGLGFCKQGEGGSFVESGAINANGAFPINTDGGGLSSNHPGRRGIFTVIESVRQLRGESPGAQLSNPQIALAHGTGGSLSNTATLVLGT